MNPRVLSTLLLLSLSLGAPSARAQAPAQEVADLPVQSTGFAFSVRTGFGLPLGLVSGGDGETELRMKDVTHGIIPVQLDAGFFLGSSFYVGASFQYGRVLLAEDCPEPPPGSVGSGCSATDLRFGVNASFHLPTAGRWSPWLGGGIGYEIFKPGNVAFKGVELFNVQAGADYHLSGPVWAGPFAMFATGKYSNVDDEQSHSWLFGGVRLLMRH
jgi:opacity protein-like surface antigen